MRTDIHDALLSVGEVAVFAWSLLELLLTRILPLAGFLAGHLLLQVCRLLASVVIRREPQAEYISRDLQAEELIDQEDNIVQVVKEDGDHQNDLESLKSSDKLEEKPVREESSILPSLTQNEDADVQAAAMPAAVAAVEAVDEHVHVAESVPSDGKMIDLRVSDNAANEVQVRGSEDGHVADVVQNHVSAKGEGSAGSMDMEPSDVERSTSPASTEGEMRKSSRRMRVLPPSLSQIKRTLMQRSRRASASPGSTSTPSPMKKKDNISPRNRKLASPAIKSSSSYDNFMGKFRKHFLLDTAKPTLLL